MRSTEYLVELRNKLNIDLENMKEQLVSKRSNQRALIEKSKMFSNSDYKDDIISISKDINSLQNNYSIIVGQISMINHILNYDTPLIRGDITEEGN